MVVVKTGVLVAAVEREEVDAWNDVHFRRGCAGIYRGSGRRRCKGKLAGLWGSMQHMINGRIQYDETKKGSMQHGNRRGNRYIDWLLNLAMYRVHSIPRCPFRTDYNQKSVP